MLSPNEREKVIATIQSKFPADNKWVQLRKRHNATWNTMGICASSFIAVACVPTFFACLRFSLESTSSVGLGFLAMCVAIGSVIGFLVSSGMSISCALERRDILKLFKDPKTKEHLRHLLKQKRSKEYVQQMLPQMSDQDIELLSKYPHTQEIFKRLITNEKNKREKAMEDQQAKEIEHSFVGVQPVVQTQTEENVVTVQTPRSLNI